MPEASNCLVELRFFLFFIGGKDLGIEQLWFVNSTDNLMNSLARQTVFVCDTL